MSTPHIQAELDAIYKKAPILASAIGSTHQHALGALMLLWGHIYSHKTNVVSGFLLKSFFQAELDVVLEALTELEFIEVADGDTWRVRGAGRYTRLSQVRSEAGKRGRAKQLQSRKESGRAGKRQQLPSKSPASAEQLPSKLGQVPSKSPAIAEQASGKSSEKGVLPGQKRALDPRSDAFPTGKLNTPCVRAREGAAAPETGSDPDPPPKPDLTDDPRVLRSLALWQAHMTRVSPLSLVDDASVLTVAADFTPEVFAAGVEHHLGEDPQFWRKQPLRYLRRRCEWARDKPPPKARDAPRRPTRGPSYAELEAAKRAGGAA